MVYGNKVWIELHKIRSTIRMWSVLWDTSIHSFILYNIYRTMFIELIWTLFFHYEWGKKFVGVIQLLNSYCHILLKQ